MSPAHVLEPTFQSLKRKLMEGAWPPGEKLEALPLADEFGVSITPVRDCLNRLVGEHLVDMKSGEGYRVPRISEQLLRDMLNLNAILLDQALIGTTVINRSPESAISHLQYADQVGSLFGIIAERSGNIILIETVRSLSDRMHAFRNVEPLVLSGTELELDELTQSLANNTGDVSSKLHDYHDRRCRNVSLLIQSVH